jgi:pyruvate-ferredoxin/flavodoxin oxidoreductase
MRDRSTSAVDWVRGLFGGRKSEPPRWSGEDALTTGRRAVVAVEALACEALCRPAAESGPVDRAATNAFGEAVGVTLADGAHGILAAASGLALAGRRVAGFLPADGLPDVQDLLRAAAERRLPLVLHAAIESAGGNGRGHGNFHALADTGAFIAFARNAQEAVDLTLVARRAAERALAPAVVALDASEAAWSVQDLRLPDPELVREFLGQAGDSIGCPTAAQTLVFGESRRRVPRWFDLDLPAALGVPLSGPDFDAAVAGRRAFFAGPMESIAEEALARFNERTGRSLSFLSRHRLDGARHVIVAQGAVLETAEAVAEHLRRTEKARVGVLGVNWLRPLREAELVESLRGAEVVTVLDRGVEPAAEWPPLMREVRSALQGRGPRLFSATLNGIDAADLVAVCRNMRAGEQARPSVCLGIAEPEGSPFPRRQAFLQRMRRDFPALEQVTLRPAEPVDLRPEGSRTVALHMQSDEFPEDALEALSRVLSETVGPHLRGNTVIVEPGLWHARVTAAQELLREPGEALPAEITLIEDVEPSLEMNPLAEAAPKGSVVLATSLTPADLWAAMRPSWRQAARERDLRLSLVRGGIDELIAAASALIRGEAGELEKVLWRELPDPPEAEADRDLPLIVRRYEGSGSSYDNVARFWGEFAQPRLEGSSERPVPDPFLALGAVPACTSTFHDMTAQREKVPVVDPGACTGCGKCWTSCPDSAIGPVVLGTEALLNAAADRAEARSGEAPGAAAGPPAKAPSAAAGKLRRAHKQLAAKLDGMLAKEETGRLAPQRLREAYEWLVQQMKVGEQELPEFGAVFEATLAEIAPLPLSVTEPFFKDAHREAKGSGELLMLAVNPQACQGCGVCAAVCPDEAIHTEPQTPRAVTSMRQTWRAWEELPDSSGKSIARAARHPRVGPLPAVLMSRHCLYSVAGGDGAEPGSGERLATRHVAAVVEYEMQRRLVEEATALEKQSGRLREAIRAAVSAALPVEHLEHLDRALGAAAREGADLGRVLSELGEMGERSDLDMARVQRMVRTASAIEEARWRIVQGMQGTGRARYGLVVAGASAAAWAARFPRNPFGVPLTVDLAGNGADLAIGLLRGLLAEREAEARLIRQAELLLEAPADLPARERELDRLTWRDLSPEELSLCPPIVVLGGPDGLSGPELGGLSRLLSCELPVKVVLLDECELPIRGADPVLLALAHRGAFVLSGSVAHPDHLFEGVTAALGFGGPALIHLYAPRPGRHRFATDATVERARLAVNTRVHPLLRYDPGAEGAFGLRLNLDGNPEPERLWATGDGSSVLTPAHWAAGEGRFADRFSDPGEVAGTPIEKFLEFSSDARGSSIPTVPGPNGRSLAVGETLIGAVEERASHWRTLQELCGVVTPFTVAVRERADRELRESHAAEIAALREEYEGKLEEQQKGQAAVQAARLRDRLLQLAGHGIARAKGEKKEEGTPS